MLDPALVQAFVISLPAAAARRAHILGCLAGRMTAHVVEAVDGRAWTPAEQARFSPDPFCVRQRRVLQPAEIACSVSHRTAMQAFLATGARYGLILEDDATLTGAAIERIGALLTALPEMDLVKLCGYASPVIGRGRVHGTAAGVTVLRVLALGERAHGYLVSRAGAERLVRTLLPVTAPIDIFWRYPWAHGCEIYETSPWLVGLTPEADASTINPVEAERARQPLRLRHLPAYLRFKLDRSLRARLNGARRFGPGFLLGRRTGFVSGLPSGEVAPGVLGEDAKGP